VTVGTPLTASAYFTIQSLSRESCLASANIAEVRFVRENKFTGMLTAACVCADIDVRCSFVLGQTRTAGFAES